MHGGAVGETRNELFLRQAIGGGRGWQGKTKRMKQYTVHLLGNRPELLSSSFPPSYTPFALVSSLAPPPGVPGGAGRPYSTAPTSRDHARVSGRAVSRSPRKRVLNLFPSLSSFPTLAIIFLSISSLLAQAPRLRLRARSIYTRFFPALSR